MTTFPTKMAKIVGGGYTRDDGSLKLGGRIYERTWVSKARWEDI